MISTVNTQNYLSNARTVSEQLERCSFNQGIEQAMEALISVAETETAREDLINNHFDALLKPLLHLTETKHDKLFSTTLCLIKKLASYKVLCQVAI